MAIEEGDEVVDFKAFQAAMADWSITGEHKFTFRYQKSDKSRNIVLLASGDGSAGNTRAERKSWIHCRAVARRGTGGAGDGSWVCSG